MRPLMQNRDDHTLWYPSNLGSVDCLGDDDIQMGQELITFLTHLERMTQASDIAHL